MATALILLVLVPVLLSLLAYDVKEHNRKMSEMTDEFDIRHIRHMQKFASDSTVVKYLVLREKTLWERVRGKVGIWAFTVEYIDENKIEYSEFYKPIPAGKYFFMKLKGWTEIADRDTALEAMSYLKWDRDIP